jgi:hypothetical protein
MKRVLRGCRVSLAAVAFCSFGPAHAADLVWVFNQDEESAFIGVVESAVKDDAEADYPFFMNCASTGDETTVVSDVDAKALGEAIAKGDVPTFAYLLDDAPPTDDGGEISDIRFDEMAGVWQYIVNGADYDLLLTAAKIRIAGAGVDFELPQKDMTATLQKFKDACDALVAGGDDSDGEDTESGN